MGIRWVVSHSSNHASCPPVSSSSSGPHSWFSIVWIAKMDAEFTEWVNCVLVNSARNFNMDDGVTYGSTMMLSGLLCCGFEQAFVRKKKKNYVGRGNSPYNN
eukprot:1154633-Pelagomonas_calceolata.AAC.1